MQRAASTYLTGLVRADHSREKLLCPCPSQHELDSITDDLVLTALVLINTTNDGVKDTNTGT